MEAVAYLGEAGNRPLPPPPGSHLFLGQSFRSRAPSYLRDWVRCWKDQMMTMVELRRGGVNCGSKAICSEYKAINDIETNTMVLSQCVSFFSVPLTCEVFFQFSSWIQENIVLFGLAKVLARERREMDFVVPM